MTLDEGWIIHWKWETDNKAVSQQVVDIVPADRPLSWVEEYLVRLYNIQTSTKAELVGYAGHPDEMPKVARLRDAVDPKSLELGTNRRLCADRVRNIEVEGDIGTAEIISWDPAVGSRKEVTQVKVYEPQ